MPREIPQSPSPPAAGQLKAVVRRRWRLGVVTFTLPCVVALGLVAFLPSLYESHALVLVDAPTTAGALEVSGARIEQLTKENLSEPQLVAVLGTLSEPADDAAVQALRRDIEIETEKVNGPSGQTSIGVAIRVRSFDPERAAHVANELADFYTAAERARLQQEAAALEAQIKDARAQLDEQEARVREFEAQHLRELPEQVQLHLASIESLNAQLEMIKENRTRALERSRTAGEAGAVAPVDPEAAELARLRQQLADLRVHASEQHPDVVRLRRTIETLEARHKPAPSAAPATRGDELDSQLRVWSREEREIEARIASVQREALNAARRGQERAALLPTYEAARTSYTDLLRRYDELQARRGESGDRVPFHVVEAARPAPGAVLPNRPRMAGLGIIFAALAALAMVWVREQVDRTFHTSAELRAFTRLPVLGHIPRIVTASDRRRRAWRSVLVTLAFALVIVAVIVATQHAAANPEVFRMVTRTGGP
ncbi:MAG: hypothetical protein ACM31C_21045 [Acidobacteriota bacterium]